MRNRSDLFGKDTGRACAFETVRQVEDLLSGLVQSRVYIRKTYLIEFVSVKVNTRLLRAHLFTLSYLTQRHNIHADRFRLREYVFRNCIWYTRVVE